MAIQIIGYGGIVADVDGATFNALKVTLRPVEYGLHGSYRLAAATGSITSSFSNSSVFQFSWSSADALAVVWGMLIDYNGSSVNAGFQQFKLFIARSITAFGSGGTAIVVRGSTGSSQELRTSMRSSMADPVLISNTAALTAGTWIQDSTPYAGHVFVVDSGGVNRSVLTQIRLFSNMARRMSCPVVLAENEALNLTLSTVTSPTFVVGVSLAWSEMGYY